MSLERLFTEHPASVGETYGEHLRAASGFAALMLFGGIACFVHALFPFLCVRTGSRCIAQLHERMVLKRAARAANHPERRIPEARAPLSHPR
jgi:hypothetical protein